MNDHRHVDPIQRTITTKEREMAARALLAVWGMSCPDCAMQVRSSLVELAGVVNAYVDYIHGIARVTFNPNMVTVPA
jgi:copper chaperone CopZ